jgi:hypothetical protein
VPERREEDGTRAIACPAGARYGATHAVFRVVDPGPARFDPECALVRVDDLDLARRLREAYDIPPGDEVTGWHLERQASDILTRDADVHAFPQNSAKPSSREH